MTSKTVVSAIAATFVLSSIAVGFLLHAEEEILEKPALDDTFDLKNYVDYYYENSSLKWIVNEEGLPMEEAERRGAASLFPTDDTIVASIESDFSERFPRGTKVDEFLAFMNAAGATHCHLQHGYIGSERVPVRFSCSLDYLVPLAFQQKVFDRERIEEAVRNERKWKDVDDYLRWQEEARWATSWMFTGSLLDEDRTRISRIKFEYDL
jgi:hypothetical protein